MGRIVQEGPDEGPGRKPVKLTDVPEQSQLPLIKRADGRELRAPPREDTLTSVQSSEAMERLLEGVRIAPLTMRTGLCADEAGPKRYSHWFGVILLDVPGGTINTKLLFNLDDGRRPGEKPGIRVVQQIYDFDADGIRMSHFHTGPQGVITYDLDSKEYMTVSTRANASDSRTELTNPPNEAQKRVFAKLMKTVLPTISPYIEEDREDSIRQAEADIFRGFVKDLCKDFDCEQPPGMDRWGAKPPKKKPGYLPKWIWDRLNPPERKQLPQYT